MIAFVDAEGLDLVCVMLRRVEVVSNDFAASMYDHLVWMVDGELANVRHDHILDALCAAIKANPDPEVIAGVLKSISHSHTFEEREKAEAQAEAEADEKPWLSLLRKIHEVSPEFEALVCDEILCLKASRDGIMEPTTVKDVMCALQVVIRDTPDAELVTAVLVSIR